MKSKVGHLEQPNRIKFRIKWKEFLKDNAKLNTYTLISSPRASLVSCSSTGSPCCVTVVVNVASLVESIRKEGWRSEEEKPA